MIFILYSDLIFVLGKLKLSNNSGLQFPAVILLKQGGSELCIL